MAFWTFLAELLLLVGLAFVFGLAARKLRQSPIIGYLAAGAVAGPLLFNTEAIVNVAEIGVALLLFSIGLEFSFHRLKAFGAKIILAGLLQILVTGGIFFGVFFPFFGTGNAMLIGIMVALSSTAVVLRILVDTAAIDSIRGRLSLGILLVQDIAVLPVLLMIGVMGGADPATGILMQTARIVGSLVGLIALFYVVFYLVLPRLLLTRGTFAERDLVVLLTILAGIGSAWAAHALGLSAALGAFVAGLLVGESPFAHQMRADIGSIRTLFLTLFFTSIGMLLDVHWLLSHLALVAAAALVVFMGKTAITFGVARLTGVSPLPAIATGITLAQIGEFSLIAASAAATAGIFPENLLSLTVATAVVSMFLAPYMVIYANPLANWLSKKLSLTSVSNGVRETEASSPSRCAVYVVGFGPAGRQIVEQLADDFILFHVIELNPVSARKARELGHRVHVGDGASPDFLQDTGIADAAVVVITVPDPESSATIIRLVRSIAPDTRIFVRARYQVSCERLKRAGADILVNEEEMIGMVLAAKLHDAVFAASDVAMACAITGAPVPEAASIDDPDQERDIR
ncbi:Glutathione-regulated potassium-efflux system protein KefB [Olavius algarvensis associated proteobacterium Delta 3]|nr:Glutathione-regulated potassium-efflux system protein KefB [Olavius algarvensis associated proteobacterium Delta 3]